MKPLLLTVLICFLFSTAFADSFIKETDYGRSLVAYFKEDLNNDGELETIKVINPCPFYTNLDELDWGDDTGMVIVIFDSDGKEVFWDEVVRPMLPIEDILIDDTNKDGFKEIVISLGVEDGYEPRTCIYGWRDGAYKLIVENK